MSSNLAHVIDICFKRLFFLLKYMFTELKILNVYLLPDANVILQCGGATVASTTTNSSGGFTITLNPLTATVAALTGNCRLVVNTPLATCNVTLPAVGGLVSQVQAVGTSLLGGLLTVVSFVPTGFVFVADLII